MFTEDLEAFTKHGKRKRISVDDVLLLARKVKPLQQHLATFNQQSNNKDTSWWLIKTCTLASSIRAASFVLLLCCSTVAWELFPLDGSHDWSYKTGCLFRHLLGEWIVPRYDAVLDLEVFQKIHGKLGPAMVLVIMHLDSLLLLKADFCLSVF